MTPLPPFIPISLNIRFFLKSSLRKCKTCTDNNRWKTKEVQDEYSDENAEDSNYDSASQSSYNPKSDENDDSDNIDEEDETLEELYTHKETEVKTNPKEIVSQILDELYQSVIDLEVPGKIPEELKAITETILNIQEEASIPMNLLCTCSTTENKCECCQRIKCPSCTIPYEGEENHRICMECKCSKCHNLAYSRCSQCGINHCRMCCVIIRERVTMCHICPASGSGVSSHHYFQNEAAEEDDNDVIEEHTEDVEESIIILEPISSLSEVIFEKEPAPEYKGKGKGKGKNSKKPWIRALSFSDADKQPNEQLEVMENIIQDDMQTQEVTPVIQIPINRPQTSPLAKHVLMENARKASELSNIQEENEENDLLDEDTNDNVEEASNENNELHLCEGSTDGFWFLGNGNTKWPTMTLNNIFVIIEDYVLLVFRVLPDLFLELGQLIKSLKKILTLFHNSYGESFKLSYMGNELTDSGCLTGILKKKNACLIYSKEISPHCGKLFTCINPRCTKSGVPRGFTRFGEFEKHKEKKGCQLYQHKLFEGKTWWEHSQFNKKSRAKPVGCPLEHDGIKSIATNSLPEAQEKATIQSKKRGINSAQLQVACDEARKVLVEAAAEKVRSSERIKGNGAYKRRADIEAMLDLSDSESEEDEMDSSCDKIVKDRTCKLKIFDHSEESKKNRQERQNNMQKFLNTEYVSSEFVPDEDDEQWEQKHIISYCLTKINKKWPKALARFDDEVINMMKEGIIHKSVNISKYCGKTYVAYRKGARDLIYLFI